MIGLLLVFAWIGATLLGGILCGWCRDGISPLTRDFWTYGDGTRARARDEA